MSQNKEETREIEEKIIHPHSGWAMLGLIIILYIAAIAGFICCFAFGLSSDGEEMATEYIILLFVCMFSWFVLGFLVKGFKLLHPNEAIVLTLFGQYYGTMNTAGFYYVNPFASPFTTDTNLRTNSDANELKININGVKFLSKKKISLKAMTLNNPKQKVNDQEGNPIEIGVVVIWRVKNTAQAVFNVEKYPEFVSTQTDASIRHVARLYPYDIGETEESQEKSLRASSVEIAEEMKLDLQKRVELAGIEIMEARIAHLAYSPEIAAVMLQRQQAKAIIVARKKIVEGAVGMVEMALDKLAENQVVTLDDERKAQMVSNLLVVLCGNKDASPVVNSGSIY